MSDLESRVQSLCLNWLQYSLCNEGLIELSNSGASGSLFYVSSDDEFIIKTVQHKEAEFLQKLLPGYFMVRCDEGREVQHDVCRINVYLIILHSESNNYSSVKTKTKNETICV